MVKCADCGYLAVRRPQSQELVCPTAEHRKCGEPVGDDAALRNFGRIPICAIAAFDISAEAQGPNQKHPSKVMQDERPCTESTPWIPALATPKEHLDMSIITENRKYNEKQLRLAREREDKRDADQTKREDARDAAQKTREDRRDFKQNVSLIIAGTAVVISLVIWCLGRLFPAPSPPSPPSPTIVIQQPQTNPGTPKGSR